MHLVPGRTGAPCPPRAADLRGHGRQLLGAPPAQPQPACRRTSTLRRWRRRLLRGRQSSGLCTWATELPAG